MEYPISVYSHPRARDRATSNQHRDSNGAPLSSMDNLPLASDGEHSEYSSGTGTLTLCVQRELVV